MRFEANAIVAPRRRPRLVVVLCERVRLDGREARDDASLSGRLSVTVIPLRTSRVAATIRSGVMWLSAPRALLSPHWPQVQTVSNSARNLAAVMSGAGRRWCECALFVIWGGGVMRLGPYAILARRARASVIRIRRRVRATR